MSSSPIRLPEPPLSDGGLALRPWCSTDVDALVAAWADPEIVRWTGVPPQRDRAYAARWIAGDEQRRAAGLALDLVVEVAGEVAGEVGLSDVDPTGRRAEIGWWIAAERRGQGLATRAVALLARWVLDELPIEVLVARCAAGNPASARVARAAGFAAAAGAGDVWTFDGCRARGTVQP